MFPTPAIPEIHFKICDTTIVTLSQALPQKSSSPSPSQLIRFSKTSSELVKILQTYMIKFYNNLNNFCT